VPLSAGVLALLVALGRDWAAAHETAQEIKDAIGSWIHAYLHRKEGDLGNAGYWYHRAGKPECRTSLDAEWEAIAAALVNAE